MNLARDLERLASFSDPGPGVTRVAWSRPHMQALDWFIGRLRENDLQAGLDAAGNVIGRWDPSCRGSALALGSHLDSVPTGGRYDGALGVLAPLAAVELLHARDFTPAQPIWIIAFMDEEGIRFGESMFGSRAFVGEDLDAYLHHQDCAGTSVAEVMEEAGCPPVKLSAARSIDRVGAFLELHVEQGRILWDAGVDLGIVTAIVGLLQARVVVRGESDHGGATPMVGRHDALVAAARMIVGLREWALGSCEVTATVGAIAVSPGAYNVIPGECSFSVDLRVPTLPEFELLADSLREIVGTISAEENVDAEIELRDVIPPAQLDERLLRLIEQAAEDEGASHLRMPSGAGHDTQVLAPHVPSAMLFVPSVGGVSHSPDEFTTLEHCDLGARVLARVVEVIDVAGLGPDSG